MDEAKFYDQITSTLSAIQALLARSIEVQQENTEVEELIHDQERKTTETVTDLLDHTELTNSLAVKQTDMARERTALIRTGLAFFSIAIAFFRMFGVSWWSLFDAALALGSAAMTVAGIVGYRRTVRVTKELQRKFAAQD